ncbi:MAG: sensor histidine kinase [Oscillospiraceae bacterium]|nr:sensor histidine kinase [Oscillospiraceae bacterium]
MKKLKSNFILKFTAVILFGVFVALIVLSAAGLFFGFECGAFGNKQAIEAAKEELLESELRSATYGIGNYIDDQRLNISDNLMYEVKYADGSLLFSNVDDSETRASYSDTFQMSYYMESFGDETEMTTDRYEYDESEYEDSEHSITSYKIIVTAYLKKDLTEKDGFYYTEKAFDFVAKKGVTGLVVMASISAILSLILFIYLMCSTGHKSGEEGIHTSRFDRFPFEILLCIFGLVILGFIRSIPWIFDEFLIDAIGGPILYTVFSLFIPLSFAYCVFAVILLSVMLVILCMTAAVRLKTKSFIKTTLVYKILRLCIKLLLELFLLCKKIFLFVGRMFSKIPLVWKTVLISLSVFVIETILLIAEEPILILLYNFIFAVCLILVAILLKNVQKGTEDIARGNIYKKINTKYMFGDVKKHAENINHINDGIAHAVEQKMKSERFKTELITNVSHDIKTPLTSIINYVDLLSKEDIDNETATGYVEVLSRQSARLKKLIDDLLEASKASTGNLTVNLSKFELGILLSQAIGEYEERFENSELEIVLNKPEEMLFIMADSRHMWRVFDNVFNNIAKYAQPHTRVYIDVTHKGKIAEIYFRNISKDQLNISGEELMERFVRGDSSRNTEGSGLGLSIAKSLAELQKGSFDIQIDGDLFKVRLAFPLCDQE